MHAYKTKGVEIMLDEVYRYRKRYIEMTYKMG